MLCARVMRGTISTASRATPRGRPARGCLRGSSSGARKPADGGSGAERAGVVEGNPPHRQEEVGLGQRALAVHHRGSGLRVIPVGAEGCLPGADLHQDLGSKFPEPGHILRH